MPTTKKTINSDLEKERRKCTFDVEELARYWIGDQSKLEEKRARGKFLTNFLFSVVLCRFFISISGCSIEANKNLVPKLMNVYEFLSILAVNAKPNMK